MVSELPWNSKTGTLKRELAQGMMDPSSKHALEAGLHLKEKYMARLTVVTMGPPMAEEILHEANAMGADRGILLTDRKMAGADTFLTSFILARLIKKELNDFDLVLCGARTADSETAQVGPQLAEELNIPSICYADHLKLKEKDLLVQRNVDDFFEKFEMALPGLVTIDLNFYKPRYATLEGAQSAFETPKVRVVNTKMLDIDDDFNALKDSPTRIIDVYSPTTQKENRKLKGAVKKIVDQLFDEYGKTISSAMGKDLKTHEHDGA